MVKLLYPVYFVLIAAPLFAVLTVWRIDYWLTSNRVADKVTKSDMIDSGARQDHTPIVMEIEL